MEKKVRRCFKPKIIRTEKGYVKNFLTEEGAKKKGLKWGTCNSCELQTKEGICKYER